MHDSGRTPLHSARCLVSAVLVCAAPLLQAEVFFEASAELDVNDNLGRSSQGEVSDTGTNLGATAGWYHQLAVYTGLSVTGSVHKTLWNRYSGLNRLDLGGDLTLSHKFGIGAAVPVLNVGVGWQRERFNTDVRDADTTVVHADLGKRFADGLWLAVEASWETVNGDNETAVPPPGITWGAKRGDVWDYEAWTLGLRGELDLGPASWLSGEFRFRDGDVVATGIVYTGADGVLACTIDPAFGPYAVAYRLDARTRIAALHYNRAVFESSTWYVGVEFQDSTASSGVDYDVGVLHAGFIHRF